MVTFVEAKGFTRRLKAMMADADYHELQRELLNNPDRGAVMPGCGGLRKVRWGDTGRGKGKRGGVRIIYLSIPEASRIYLLDIYGKDEKDDLSAAERRELAALAKEARREAIEQRERSGGVR